MKELNRWMGTKEICVVIIAAVALIPAVDFGQNYGQQNYGQPSNYDQSYNQAAYDDQQADPPSRVARVSVASGNVSLEPASVQQFNMAETNYPMTTGDRIYADLGATAEIQTGQIAVRLGQQTDLTVTAMTDTLAQFGLAQGSVHLRSFNIYQGEAVELDTPNVAVTVLQAGDVRVDVDPNTGDTSVSVISGQVQVDGSGLEQVLESGERLHLSRSNPVQAQMMRGGRMDGLDRFSLQRDSLYMNSYAAEQEYLNPGTIGAEDLTAYGSWQDDPDNGAVWYPTGVAADWQPYRNGHWTWVAPWGWTWIEAEPWGFAPFHYGRWGRFGGRWGWVPGPPVVRPVYSPALVAFVGGGGFGGGVTAWFPLGPRETYQPWYQTSPRYVNRVNVSNIYNRNSVEVRNIYNQRTVVNVYANSGGNRDYANRMGATVAVTHDNFASGRRVDQAMVHVDTRQMAGAQVLAHPAVSPQRQMIVQTPARAVPPVMQRPVLASHEDQAIRPNPGGPRVQGGPVSPQGGQQRYDQGRPFGQPNQQPNQQQAQPNQQNQQQPGRFRQGQQPNQQIPVQQQQPGRLQDQLNRSGVTQGNPQQNNNGKPRQGMDGQQNGRQPQQPATTQTPAQPAQGGRQPQPPVTQSPAQSGRPQQPVTQQPATTQQAPATQQQVPQRGQPQPTAPPAQQPAEQQQFQQQQQRQQEQRRQQDQQRQLFNKAVPPEPRPSFDQQRQVMEKTEPGKPLNQQQVNSLRQNQPAPQPQQTPAAAPQQRPTTRPEGQQPHGGPVKPAGPPPQL